MYAAAICSSVVRPIGESASYDAGEVGIYRISSPQQIFAARSADIDDEVTMGRGERLIEEPEDELGAAVPHLSSSYIRPERRVDGSTQTG